jgi:AbrB family looped-hinge helix DNA binding protein
MRTAKITSAGQVSLPAEIRRRWGAQRVTVDDRGDHVVLKPLPDDPIAAVRGILRGRIPPSEELRKVARRDEESAVSRRRHS